MELSFNELCLNYPVKSRKDADMILEKFFSGCKEIGEKIGDEIKIRTSKDFQTLQIFEPLIFSKWISSLSDKDEKRRILIMVTQLPLKFNYPEYSHNTVECIGFGYANENDLLGVSLLTDLIWDTDKVSLKKEYINEEKDNLEEENVEQIHWSDKKHISSHLSWIEKKKAEIDFNNKSKIINGEDLWDRREVIFDKLIFCESTYGFISQLSPNDIDFKHLLSKFFEYNKYMKNWAAGDFNLKALSGRPRKESDSRTNTLEEALKIKCPDDNFRFFELHFDFGEKKGKRVHFYPDEINKVCYIGYVGNKIV